MAPELASKKFGTEKSSGTVMGKIWCRRIPGNFTFFGRYQSQYRKNLVLKKVPELLSVKFGEGEFQGILHFLGGTGASTGKFWYRE